MYRYHSWRSIFVMVYRQGPFSLSQFSYFLFARLGFSFLCIWLVFLSASWFCIMVSVFFVPFHLKQSSSIWFVNTSALFCSVLRSLLFVFLVPAFFSSSVESLDSTYFVVCVCFRLCPLDCVCFFLAEVPTWTCPQYGFNFPRIIFCGFFLCSFRYGLFRCFIVCSADVIPT